TGVSDYGDVLLMPSTGDVRLNNGADGRPGYASSFDKADEQASPGYYRTVLKDYGVTAELTATTRVGVHRYTFPPARPAHVVMDLEHRDETLEAQIAFNGDREISGMRRSRAWAQDQHVYFVARFSRPFATHGIAVDGLPQDSLGTATGKRLKCWVGFGDEGGDVVVKVGISAVSIDGARRNLDAEVPGWDFDNVRARAVAAWERELSRIQVDGGNDRQRTIFYTALYHTLLSPNVFVDVDGSYRGRDLMIHRANDFNYYTVFSLWDTFRALHPLMTITNRRRTSDFVRTFVRQYQEGGRLPIWELAGNETYCMIGYHAVPVIADAMMKGITGFDEQVAFEAMKHSAEEDRRGLKGYRRAGYIPAEEESESVSQTLEYAYDDWCIAMVAQKLGRLDDYASYMRRAQSYKNLFDPSVGFMRSRLEGTWFAPFDPAEVNFNYTEANAWQYTFFAPQDMDGLMDLFGGKRAFAAKLDALFGAESKIAGNQQADITGMVGQYAHGNEPSHHIAYLYAFAGEPWKTQAMVRRLMDTMYTDRPDGLIGNEDCGQMSAWFVMSALGFYSVTPGSNQYVIGTPLFPKATIRLENGSSFVISAPGVSQSACYIAGARLNGAPYSRSFLEHAAIARGGEIVFEMSDRPNMQWGASDSDVPRTAIVDDPIVPVPFVAKGAAVFEKTTGVTLGDVATDAEIHYTLDGSEPTPKSKRYDMPIAIDETTTVKAVAVVAGRAPSAVLAATFHEIPEGRSIRLNAAYSRQYSAGGDNGLIDGLRGGANFRDGRWQGYQGTDLEVVVDLGSPRAIRRVSMGFLQDAPSWILMPRTVVFAVSDDGVNYVDVGTVASGVADTETGVVVRDLGVSVDRKRARYVRVRVAYYGALPKWHPGAGNPAFFFADEIVIE
ncbi:MAG TPA: GH92 family glycosyl hydrolase, partial [Blastocatellia bacterium]|nr:GH92 family glycosyl hydrolase [Blastocatellia bacterium]